MSRLVYTEQGRVTPMLNEALSRIDQLRERHLAAGCALAPGDAVLHLAAAITPDLTEARRVNRNGTAATAAACRQAGVRRLVHLSTTAVYDLRQAGELVARLSQEAEQARDQAMRESNEQRARVAKETEAKVQAAREANERLTQATQKAEQLRARIAREAQDDKTRAAKEAEAREQVVVGARQRAERVVVERRRGIAASGPQLRVPDLRLDQESRGQ
jgi:hypothetical protein